MPSENHTAIELIGLTKQFKECTAVQGVDLQIKGGEFFSLLGPSGCGKTTTLRMIAGLENPTAGTILLEGEEVTWVPPYRRDVNTVFQDYAIFPHMNVYENIYYPLRMKKIPRRDAHERILRVLRLVNMTGFEYRFSNQLSGGQRQRIALARALVNEPKALLLDEPLGALDFKLRVAMQSALKELQTKLSMTFVYVTHDQTEAITMSDRIAVMKDGVVHQVGTPEEIYCSPATAFVASFIGDMNFLEGEVREVHEDTVLLDVLGRKVVSRKGKHTFSQGDQVLMCIRPEKVCIDSDLQCENEVSVHLKRVVFRGNDFEIWTDINGIELRSVVDCKAWTGTHKPGDTIPVKWQVSDTIVFPIEMKDGLINYGICE